MLAGDIVKAMKTEALISAGVIDESSASDFEKLDATLSFVDTVTEARDLGVDMSAQLTDLGTKSVEELEAKTNFTTSQNQLVEKGVLTADDAKSRAENSSSLSVDQLKEQSQSNNNLKQQIDQGLSVEDATLIAENAAKMGEVFRGRMQKFIETSKLAQIVRGKGLLNAIVIDSSVESDKAWNICLKLKDNGLLAKPTHGNIIRFAPPLIINQQEIEECCNIIETTIKSFE